MAQCFRTVATKSINAPAVVFAKDYPCLTLGAAGLREHGAARDPDQSSPTFDGVVVCREIARRIAMQLQSTHYCLRPQIVGGGIGDHFGQSDAGESVVQCRSRSFGGISVSARLLRFAQPVQNPAARVIPAETIDCGTSVLCFGAASSLCLPSPASTTTDNRQRRTTKFLSSTLHHEVSYLPMRVSQTPNSTEGSIIATVFTASMSLPVEIWENTWPVAGRALAPA